MAKVAHSHRTPARQKPGKQHRPFGEPVSYVPARGERKVRVPAAYKPKEPLTMSLLDALDAEAKSRVEGAASLIFHCVGDTGGIYGPQAQEPVAHAMETQFHVPAGSEPPTFFYHLGDVVYFNGLAHLYTSQFYEPYQYYPAPIFAIPGNHDGDTSVRKNDPPDHEPSLTGFYDNFCADPKNIHSHKYRDAMDQPYFYWTLDAKFVTIIGLYSNVDGTLDDGEWGDQQQKWLVSELKAAKKNPNQWSVLAVHHPPYSLDAEHGGYPQILSAIEQATKEARFWPDVVLSGHVHNYQRFERTENGKAIPLLIAGAGGYANTPTSLHKLQKGIPDRKTFETTRPGVVLKHSEQELPGFLRITVTEQRFLAEYFTVPFGDPQSGIPTLADQVSLTR